MGATYGLPDERFVLSPTPGPAPGFLRPGLPWVIVTAWNPAGERARQAQNETAHRLLGSVIRRSGKIALTAVNGEQEWAEPAFYVPEATLTEAKSWGHQFGQAATLFGVGSRAALVWADGQIERCWTLRRA